MKHQQAIYYQYPVSDNSWMMEARIVRVPSVEPRIVAEEVRIEDVLDLTEFMVEDWPSYTPVLN